ncbi:MAG: hypothetical protein IKW81_03200 [Pseudobutyrivibrio sp.]|nr:hypothetical protein [Pseudobutyrivibrio sp.]
MKKILLINAKGICEQCGNIRRLYFTNGDTYGEKIVSSLDGEKFFSISSFRCPKCMSDRVIEDKEYGEKLESVNVHLVSHAYWEGLSVEKKGILK